ncbi:MAG TPA: hypothetical protein DCG75_06675 [Bacteroidales bacterium]|jgi:hypothetical protein|nr:hypothetical protein [Bacteroidales bacterium]
MRKLIVLILAFGISLNVSAQDVFKFKFFPSISFGYLMNPEDVNNYISDDLSSYSITFGTTDIVMSFNFGIGGSFRFYNLIEVQPLVEYSYAPKIISGADESYAFNKFSGGMMANFLIPISSERKSSVIIGAGLLYNSMSFEEFSGSSLNPRFQTGLSLNNDRFNPQIIFAYDLAKATDDEYESFELNYSSIRIGVNLNF